LCRKLFLLLFQFTDFRRLRSIDCRLRRGLRTFAYIVAWRQGARFF
jgi:hypothetical protein